MVSSFGGSFVVWRWFFWSLFVRGGGFVVFGLFVFFGLNLGGRIREREKASQTRLS